MRPVSRPTQSNALNARAARRRGRGNSLVASVRTQIKMTFLTETDVDDDVEPEATAEEAGKVCVFCRAAMPAHG